MRKFRKPAMLLFALLSVTVLSSSISGCAKVSIKDDEVCADLGVAGAQCAHPYSHNRRTLTKRAWDQERVGWMCSKAEAVSDKEDSIEELCRRLPTVCDYETREAIAKVKAGTAPLIRAAKLARRKALLRGEIDPSEIQPSDFEPVEPDAEINQILNDAEKAQQK